MNRLTNNQGFARNVKAREEMYDKLFELENIEESLGCPLEVVFKAMKPMIAEGGGIYIERDYDGYIRFGKWSVYSLINTENGYGFIPCFENESQIRYLKDYKKTWWLKEDKSE